jgi:hypothetical protein
MQFFRLAPGLIILNLIGKREFQADSSAFRLLAKPGDTYVIYISRFIEKNRSYHVDFPGQPLYNWNFLQEDFFGMDEC